MHSAHITAGDILALSRNDPFQTGPMYIPMPTGSGKTTGALWAIERILEEQPHIKICFLTPYQTSVEEVSAKLAERLGSQKVGFYYSGGPRQLQWEISKPVLVITHNLLQFQSDRLKDRDLFIVDEALFATAQANLKIEDINAARTWATSHNVMPDAFEALSRFANAMDEQIRESAVNYIAAPQTADLSWANTIANDLKLHEHSQTINNPEQLSAVQVFCEALLKGLVFASKGKLDNDRYQPAFYCAVFGIPNIEKTAVLSATGGLVYDIVGPFKQSHGSTGYWTPPSYSDLTLVQLGGPKISGRYSSWVSAAKRDQVVAYVDWLLKTIPEKEIYITVPKQVLELCLRNYFGVPSKSEIEYPLKTTKHGKEVWVSNHARGVGSNQFKDCDAVVYLWDDHKPQALSIERFHTLADEPVTDEALEHANSGRLSGEYVQVREAMYIDNMMQQIGRGRIRQFDEEAIAYPMTAYVLTEKGSRFVRLAAQYPDCNTTTMSYEGNEPAANASRIEQIVNHLRLHGHRQDVSGKEVEEAVGFRISVYGHKLENNWELSMINYRYVKGEKGRGKSAYFKYTGN